MYNLSKTTLYNPLINNSWWIFVLAFSVGRGALAGGSVLGIGALAYYGLGMGSGVGALEKQQ